MSDPYPFEAEDEGEIRELDLESVDTFGEARITVGELVGENESWRYGHVIVDEAQDLTPMQWRMVMRRVRGKALTIVGDLAQRSASAAQSWEQLLPPELSLVQRQDLTVNYRSPAEIHDLAVSVLASFAPTVEPSQAIRAAGWDPEFEAVEDLARAVEARLYELLDLVGGQIAVISANPPALELSDALVDNERLQVLTPVQSKGLEFDAVVLAEPAEILAQQGGASQLYIALTRAMQRLVVLHVHGLPAVLDSH